MDLFNIICGTCSIVGLLVSIFTAGKVIKISKTYNYGSHGDGSRVANKGDWNTYNGTYIGRDKINEMGSQEQT